MLLLLLLLLLHYHTLSLLSPARRTSTLEPLSTHCRRRRPPFSARPLPPLVSLLSPSADSPSPPANTSRLLPARSSLLPPDPPASPSSMSPSDLATSSATTADSPVFRVAFEDLIHPSSLLPCGAHDPSLLELIRSDVSNQMICASLLLPSSMRGLSLARPATSQGAPPRPTATLRRSPFQPTRRTAPARPARLPSLLFVTDA